MSIFNLKLGRKIVGLSMTDRLEKLSIPCPESGCWLWLGTISQRGYGTITVDGKKVVAHRVSFQAYIGEIPEGMLVCHKCDTRSCVNPTHLFIGTAKDNTQDMIAKGRKRQGDARGEKNPNRKINQQIANEIRESCLPVKDLVEKYQLCKSMIHYIRNGTHWKE